MRCLGHPELITKIAEEIRLFGPITFARFMDLSLYEPTHGYYMRGRPGDERIGWDGDFYTSADLHPAFAAALARQLRQADDLLGQPDPFTVVEMGPGKGLLARDLLSAGSKLGGSFLHRLRYVLVERSPAMKGLQRANLACWLQPEGRLRWVDSLRELDTDSLVGVFFSNELVDAFPVHRVKVHQGELKEFHVDFQEGWFCETLLPLSTPEISRHLQRLEVTLQEGQITEINLHALDWLREVARVLGQGLVITIDYGHTAQDFYSPDRLSGTLLCYHRHKVLDDPYHRVGLQDMTAHVDFTSLALIGEQTDLTVTGFTNQMGFLAGLGIEETLGTLDPDSAEFHAVVALIRPQGMGRTFKVLIQHKGLDRPELDGLRFKPFFASALTTKMSTV